MKRTLLMTKAVFSFIDKDGQIKSGKEIVYSKSPKPKAVISAIEEQKKLNVTELHEWGFVEKTFEMEEKDFIKHAKEVIK